MNPRTLWQLQLQAWRDPVQRRRLFVLLLLSLTTLPLAYWLPSLLPPAVVLLGGVEVAGSTLVWGLRAAFLSLVSLSITIVYTRTVLRANWDSTLPFPVALAKGVATVPAIAVVYESVQLFLFALLGGLSQQYLLALLGFLLWELFLAFQLLTFHLFHPEWGIPSFYTAYASGRAPAVVRAALIGAAATGVGIMVHEFNEAQIAEKKAQIKLKQFESDEKIKFKQLENDREIKLKQLESDEKIKLKKIELYNEFKFKKLSKKSNWPF